MSDDYVELTGQAATDYLNRAPTAECSVCHRKTWQPTAVDTRCDFPQPNGIRCSGFFIVPPLEQKFILVLDAAEAEVATFVGSGQVLAFRSHREAAARPREDRGRAGGRVRRSSPGHVGRTSRRGQERGRGRASTAAPRHADRGISGCALGPGVDARSHYERRDR